MRRYEAILGGICLAAGVLTFAWGVMRDMDERYLEWGVGLASYGGTLLLLYALFRKRKRTTPPTGHERPV